MERARGLCNEISKGTSDSVFLTNQDLLGEHQTGTSLHQGLASGRRKDFGRATRRIYTKDYLIGYEKTKQALKEVEKDNPSIILEIACGRGGFFKPFIRSRQGKGVYVATDFSPTVLRSNLKWLRTNDLEKQVALMAFDATAMPFRDNSIPAAVSNVGFPNIGNGGKTVNEAFRVLAPSGILVANFMFTTEKTENYAKAKELGFDQFYTKESTVEVFRKAGFKFNLEELHRGLVRPTPGGIDFFPIVQDIYSFCVIKATKPE